MADKIKGVPDGLTEEPLQSNAQIQGVPAGLTAEPVKPSAPQNNQPSRIADSLANATISPPEPGVTAWLDRQYNKVKTALSGGGRPDAAVDVMGGMALGPIRATKGVSQLPDHPIRGVNNIIGGVGQTVALPMAVVNPATMAYAAPAVAAQHATQSGLKAMGVDPDYAELGGNIAGIAAGGAVHKAPEIAQTAKVLAKPVLKTVLETAKSTPVLGGAIKGLTTFKDVAPALRDIWAKPSPEVTADDVQVAEPAPAPYRKSGSQIQDAITVTPRTPFVPKGLLKAAPDTTGATAPAPEALPSIAKPAASSPKTAQTAILKNIGVASPSATLKLMTRIPSAEITPRPDLSFAGSRSGESAAMNQLTENFSPQRLGINDLRGIAQARGLNVDPADTHSVLINKIHDSLTPEELDKFEQAAQERMRPDYSISQ